VRSAAETVRPPGRRVAPGNGAEELSEDEAKVLEVLRAAAASQTARGFVLYSVDPRFSYEGPRKPERWDRTRERTREWTWEWTNRH